MKPPPAEWQGFADVHQLLLKRGYQPDGMEAMLNSAIASGKLRVRIAGQVCAPEKVRLLSVDCAQQLFFGWFPRGRMMFLEVNEETNGVSMGLLPDRGHAGEFNALDLSAYLLELHTITAEIPAPRNRGGRPTSWAWGRAMMAILTDFAANGLPETYAPYVEILRAWFTAECSGECPDDSQLRDYARQAWEALCKGLGL